MLWIIVFAAAFGMAFLLCQWKGDTWEETVRNGLYTLSGDSIPNFAVDKPDENGIPHSYYPMQNGIEAGWQYNATIVCNYAIGYHRAMTNGEDTMAVRHFKNCVEWLSQNMTWKDSTYALHMFHWQQPWYDSVKAPFTSGMTSGLAMQVFTLAFKEFQDSGYLTLAHALMRGFFVPIQKGGFTYKEQQGWWYEEIADTNLHTPRILDGHIFALLGAYHYWQATRHDSAKQVFDQGILALKNQLPRFNPGDGSIWYDIYHKTADKKYHRTLTSQMKELWEITGDPIFNEYYLQWNAPLKRPYMLRAVNEKNRSGILLFVLLWAGIVLVMVISLKIILKKKHSLSSRGAV